MVIMATGSARTCRRGRADRLALVELSADLADECRIMLSNGGPAGRLCHPPRSRLHFLTDARWYQLDVDDIPG